MVAPVRVSAESMVAMMRSTRRRRDRWRNFWVGERRQGIFLQEKLGLEVRKGGGGVGGCIEWAEGDGEVF